MVALYCGEGDLTEEEKREVKTFITNDAWDIGSLNESIFEEMHDFIVNNIKSTKREITQDCHLLPNLTF